MVVAMLGRAGGRRRLPAARSRPIPPKGWTSCWPTRRRRWCSPRRGSSGAGVPEARTARAGLPRSRLAGDRRRAARQLAGGGETRSPRVHDLHLGLDRPPQGRRHRAPQRHGAAALGARGLPRPRPCRRAGLDLDLLRPLGLRAVPAALPRRHRDARRDGPPPAAARGGGRGDAGQYVPSGHRRAGAGRRACRRRCARWCWRASRCRAGWWTRSTPGGRRAGLQLLRPPRRIRPTRPTPLIDRAGGPPPIGRPVGGGWAYLLDAGVAAGAAGRRRRALPGRRGPRPRLSGPPRADRRAFRAGPLLRRARRPPLPHRRPRPLPAGRRDAVPRPRRPPGEDPRLPHRAGGDRGCAAPAIRRWPRRWCSPAARPASSASSPTWWAATPPAPAAEELRGFLRVKLPAHMIPWALRGAVRPAAQRQRQARPQGPARSRAGRLGRSGADGGAADRHGADRRRSLAAGPSSRTGRNRRQLLRFRRPFAAGHPRPPPAQGGARPGSAPGRPVRAPDDPQPRPVARGRRGGRAGIAAARQDRGAKRREAAAGRLRPARPGRSAASGEPETEEDFEEIHLP